MRELGFLSFVPNHGGPAGAAAALEDGLRLFETAERLGYGTGWVRGRHFEPFLTSPMTFFAAAAQRTSTIGFGTAVLGMRYEDPVRLAEDASTVDLLSGGRVQLGISTGIAGYGPILDPVFGGVERSFRDEAEARAARLLEVLDGEPLGTAGKGYESIPAGADLTLQPLSPALRNRVWWGGGSMGTALRTAEKGLLLHCSTLNTEDTGEPFAVAQAAQIDAYRARFAELHGADGRTPKVAVGRIVVPLLDDHDRAVHQEFLTGYASGMDDEGRPLSGTPPFRFSKVVSGEPAAIVDALRADPAVAATDELVITLPANGDAASHERILTVIAEQIAPHLND
ncbi:alkanesulfonate monooxygenase SsuD/methylene tetrahydromethanopterin reductase-like flavin-dependent oxidoreductase (luciferase family) [Curtobacterium sp. PhB130]|uniref:LLM class flavin-dependent oxidoreductase n=1 Tax=Curtobacterium sp. PhB130 TaxID=2485178 RepID=UPI000F4BE46C|nr:LLM class flavin-dependent oxidoreductase [Curtobacterium sp. PhB130]ROS75638.1 alkanesulfonate monooxygenase SsuD/methylene tetrahydromethanopterin reductase-like flavin-dependent oxidoreductase (luciferase family) [Curtobacterium sp. PhB130]